MKKEQNENQEQKAADEVKRDFMKKFGKYSVATPLAVFALMSPLTSKKAIASPGPIDDGP